jgi:GNAT superfamily N-acetyltransferase
MTPNNHRTLSKPFQTDEDFWRIRELLVETYPITPTGFNWDVRNWDGERFYNADPGLNPRWAARIRLWETETGQLIGAVHPEGEGDAHLQIHPDYRSVEEQMIEWAESNLGAPTGEEGVSHLHLFVYEYDETRQLILEKRGYEKTASYGVRRRMELGSPLLPKLVLAAGYRMRNPDPDDRHDCQRIADLLNAAFNRDFHNAAEYQSFTQHAPSYRNDLDLVVEASDGSFAAYVGVPYDDINCSGIFEPVCTHPDHRRKGLARALMLEGLHRLQQLGASDVTVSTGEMVPANRLYEAVGFNQAFKANIWKKEFSQIK